MSTPLPNSGPTREEVAVELERLATLVRSGDDGLLEAWVALHGDDDRVPYTERREPLHRRFPTIQAWCVVKIESKPPWNTPRIWPGQAYADKATAEEWCDFLSDFYYDTHVRDGKTCWLVMPAEANCGDYYRGSGRRVGDGYSDRSGWVGTLPMERWEKVWHDNAPMEWRRKEAA